MDLDRSETQPADDIRMPIHRAVVYARIWLQSEIGSKPRPELL
jgi:hypothetical protein